MGDFNGRMTGLLVSVFAIILGVVILGEGLGLFDFLNDLIPFPLGVVFVIAGGYPVFRNVIRATLKRQIISHSLMTLGVIAALVVGQWVAAALVVVFMRIGDYVENFTTESARRAVKELMTLAPQTARVDQMGLEVEIPISQVKLGDIVIVRPGEKIPVDGEVIGGQATVDQAAITGESMPVEAASGTHVFAATIAKLGSLRIRTERIGTGTTFGRVVKMVEEAGTLTLGRPQVTDVISLNGLSRAEVLSLAASAERYSEHPLAEAVRTLVHEENVALIEPKDFEAVPGYGVRAVVDGYRIAVGNRRMIPSAGSLPLTTNLEAQGKTLLFLERDHQLVGVLAAQDTLRSEVPAALAEARSLGIRHIELLTGDNERTASALAEKLGVAYRANLLQENKIDVVKEYQAKGHVVVAIEVAR